MTAGANNKLGRPKPNYSIKSYSSSLRQSVTSKLKMVTEK